MPGPEVQLPAERLLQLTSTSCCTPSCTCLHGQCHQVHTCCMQASCIVTSLNTRMGQHRNAAHCDILAMLICAEACLHKQDLHLQGRLKSASCQTICSPDAVSHTATYAGQTYGAWPDHHCHLAILQDQGCCHQASLGHPSGPTARMRVYEASLGSKA